MNGQQLIEPQPGKATQVQSKVSGSPTQRFTLALSHLKAKSPTQYQRWTGVRIDNSSSLETRALEQESNPNPGFPWASGPVDCRTAHPRCSGIEPSYTDIKNIDSCSKKSQTKEIIAPNGRLITVPNGVYTSNQSRANPRKRYRSRPSPMTTTLKQDNQVAKSKFFTNERTPGPSAILLPLDPSTQFPRPYPSQCPDEPPWKMLSLEVSSRSPGLPAPLLAVFHPPGVPFGPVHFTNYPLKPEYKEYTPEKILKFDPLARIQSAIRYNRQGLWIFPTPKLFRGKFNYLPAYNLSIEPPVTPKPMPASLPNLPTDHSGKLFGIVYITLAGVIDTITLAAGLWSWVGKSASYLLKLAPLLWWALPAKNWPKLPLKIMGRPLKTGSLTTGLSSLLFLQHALGSGAISNPFPSLGPCPTAYNLRSHHS
ncbi:hypothetical protein DSO57_1022021 [Entomophthora muscae]|uniref:Uncharacterized protein n=1 Tax=Entomophthora muscae TaxID=34485 RepID=A0ACC2TEB2_9FUNG|nr:hypothetical protein DSO57_1022021 [Entomophthora muscae]